MTAASHSRLAIAHRVLDAHRHLPGLRVAFVTGSTAEGIADERSDLDMFLGFGALPPEAALRAVRQGLDPNPPKWQIGSYDDGEFAVSILIDGVEVQYGCHTLASTDREIDRLVAGDYVRAPEQKIAMGLGIAEPLLGDDVLLAWRRRLEPYPEALREAMFDAHMPKSAIWRTWPRIENRDAALWVRKECVEAGYLALGLLAAINGVWHSDFQFKRTDRFCASLKLKPAGLESLLDDLANAPIEVAVGSARTLFAGIADLMGDSPRASLIRKL